MPHDNNHLLLDSSSKMADSHHGQLVSPLFKLTVANSPHSELISLLTELYTLLDSLAAIPDNLLRLPSPDTGVHAPDAVNTAAATAAGYDPDTVALMCALPYLDVGIAG